MGKNSACKIIAIAGPTASGKSTFANRLKEIASNEAAILCLDNYYKDWSHLAKKERKRINFDSIKAFDLALIRRQLKMLKENKAVLAPLYDFIQSRRLRKKMPIKPMPIIIIDGLVPFFDKELRDLCDYKIYIDATNATCLARRIKRDIKDRGETVESVCVRYFKDVLPMQKKYVEPQKKWADLVINGKNDKSL